MNPNEQELVESLRNAVETSEGSLVKDGRLATERELTQIFKVSRRSVRIALDDLEKQGLLFRLRGQGTFLRPTSPSTRRLDSLANSTSPVEVMEVRREIEPALARLAAMRATPSEINQMQRLVDRAAEAELWKDYERWDSALHAKLAESSRNSLFVSLFNMIQAVRVEHNWMALRSQVFNLEVRDGLTMQHVAIIDAVRSRDAPSAESAMREHLQSVSDVTGT